MRGRRHAGKTRWAYFAIFEVSYVVEQAIGGGDSHSPKLGEIILYHQINNKNNNRHTHVTFLMVGYDGICETLVDSDILFVRR